MGQKISQSYFGRLTIQLAGTAAIVGLLTMSLLFLLAYFGAFDTRELPIFVPLLLFALLLPVAAWVKHKISRLLEPIVADTSTSEQTTPSYFADEARLVSDLLAASQAPPIRFTDRVAKIKSSPSELGRVTYVTTAH